MGDYFKIVAIITKKGSTTKVEYTYVPHQWVKNGIVFWPPNNSLTLRDDPSSAPDELEWKKFKCKVKKDFIIGKEEAELWEEEYLNASCTESEETLSINQQLLPINDNGNENLAKTINKTNIDVLFDNIAASTPNVNINAANDVASTNIKSKQISLSFRNEDGILVQEFNDDMYNVIENVSISKDQEEVSLNTIYQKLLTIEESQRQIEENQLRLLEIRKSDNSLSKLTLDKIYNMIKSLHDGTILKPTASHEEPNESGFASKFIFPLNTVSDVQAFNSEIEKNVDYKKYLASLLLYSIHLFAF